MKDLIIIVEGQTEVEFVNRILYPYFVGRGLNTTIRPIPITMKGGGHGFNNIEHFKNTIRPLLHKQHNYIITTIIDYYGINSETKLPGYSKSVAAIDVRSRIKNMEAALNDVVQSIVPCNSFIPYIQQHEMETLLFANPRAGFDLEHENIAKEVEKVCAQFASIEDINCTPEGAPSKRLEAIYESCKKKYIKTSDAVIIAELSGIDAIIAKCPSFAHWIETIIVAVKNS